jgi:phage gpG-like protein
MLTITIDADVFLAQVATFPSTVNAALAAKTQLLAQALADKVKSDKLSSQVLQSKTGRLSGGIDSNVEQEGDVISGNVFASGDVPYAAIQEYGGVTKAHVIEAVNGKALAFNMGGKTAILQHVNHPGSVIPERSYLRSSLDESRDDILAGFSGALSSAIDSTFNA